MRNIVFIIAVLSLPITACGVKPKSVDAPEGAEDIVFPKQYPQAK